MNLENLENILDYNLSNEDTFQFAIVSDSHIEYPPLEDAVKQINKDDKILFVVHLGDITDGGIYKEYKWTNDIMSELEVPYIMTIGNHDYRSNGLSVYNKMYGNTSFSFVFVLEKKIVSSSEQ